MEMASGGSRGSSSSGGSVHKGGTRRLLSKADRIRRGFVFHGEKPISPKRRLTLILRAKRMAGLTSDELALYARVTKEFANRVVSHFFEGKRERHSPLLHQVHERFMRHLGQITGEQARTITRMSRETERHAQRLLPKSELPKNPNQEGYDLVLPTRHGAILFQVKQCLQKDDQAFLLLRTKNGLLANEKAHEFLVFTLESLHIIRASELREFVQKYFHALRKFVSKKSGVLVYVPLEELVQLRWGRKTRYRNWLQLRPPHFPQ